MTRRIGVVAVGILLAAAAVLGGVVIADASGADGPPRTSTPPAPQPSAAEGPAPRPADPDGFEAAPFDVTPQIKVTAVRFVQSVGTWTPSSPTAASERLTAAGYPADLVAVAGPLLDESASSATTQVVYPQYGGLTDTTASVMVLARQELRDSSGTRGRDVLLDVRLAREAGGTWEITSRIDPARPAYAEARPGGPTEVGGQVLGRAGINLPGPARDDIVERRTGDPILTVLATLAQSWDLDVQVLVSGHPGTVFPTTRVSNHTVGRAVDVRAIDGRPVAAIPRDDPVLTSFMAAAGAAGATEVGGPVLPAGTGFFTDAVHQDHVHIGITPTKPPASAA
ncbi:hypothetical protein [Pseudonocardia hydrocarbonoxydans]|uniref:hypothetical protein n=1 Tax=Pseudonocardia hydrocarbonoxydans TaxID=76726 RepID=UPI0031E36E6C